MSLVKAEPDFGLAVGVYVVAGGLHGDSVAHHALDRGGDLGGGAGVHLGVDRHAALLDVPVDQHAAAAVAGVTLGEDVAVEGGEVGGDGGYRGGAFAPDSVLPGSEGGVGHGDGGGLDRVQGEVAAGGVA